MTTGITTIANLPQGSGVLSKPKAEVNIPTPAPEVTVQPMAPYFDLIIPPASSVSPVDWVDAAYGALLGEGGEA